MSALDLAGAGVVVTGAASGIGLGLATRFAAEGARVVAVDRDPQDAALARRGELDGLDVEAEGREGGRDHLLDPVAHGVWLACHGGDLPVLFCGRCCRSRPP